MDFILVEVKQREGANFIDAGVKPDLFQQTIFRVTRMSALTGFLHNTETEDPV